MIIEDLEEVITISIASYRDPDLLRTVSSCFHKANNRDRLFFSIFSQAEDSEHPDLSFIPESQIRYQKIHWSESLGMCWARAVTNEEPVGEYFLQIDSHSRFRDGWDDLVIENFKASSRFWGNRIILTGYPEGFELGDNSSDILFESELVKKFVPFWEEETKTIQGHSGWMEVVDTVHGDEVFFLSGNCMFTTSEIIKELPSDPMVYFTGDEAAMALRAYTRGVRLISPVSRFMFTNYNRPNSNRRFHWDDHDKWRIFSSDSYGRIARLMSGDQSLEEYGIGSQELFQQYQKIVGIDLVDKYKTIIKK
jgi:hypothetical protein